MEKKKIGEEYSMLVVLCLFMIFDLFVEVGSHCVAQTGLELTK